VQSWTPRRSEMPAVSKAQQRFFGMVRATQKGEMENPSSEVTKAASSMSKSDVKKFAKTKHKGLPNKVEEESNPRIPRKEGQPANSKKHSDLYTDENPKGTIHGLGFKDVATAKASVSKIRNSSRSHAHKIQAAVAMEQRAREMGKTAEAAVYRKFINSMKKKTKKMNEETKYDRYDKEKKKFAKADQKMKFGKFYDRAKESQNRLRPGEVKRYDKNLGRYVSNKD